MGAHACPVRRGLFDADARQMMACRGVAGAVIGAACGSDPAVNAAHRCRHRTFVTRAGHRERGAEDQRKLQILGNSGSLRLRSCRCRSCRCRRHSRRPGWKARRCQARPQKLRCTGRGAKPPFKCRVTETKHSRRSGPHSNTDSPVRHKSVGVSSRGSVRRRFTLTLRRRLRTAAGQR